ncbi:50S ribosomal protein L24e [Thermoproteota archaeon]
MAKCTFCSKPLPHGTGKMYVKKDGKLFYFCSSKCEKNQLKLKRKPRYVKWTEEAQKEKKEGAATQKKAAKKKK